MTKGAQVLQLTTPNPEYLHYTHSVMKLGIVMTFKTTS